MTKAFSFKIALKKGLVSLLVAVGALVAFAGFSDLSINDLYTQYVAPTIGALTVGGLVRMLLNYIKFHSTA